MFGFDYIMALALLTAPVDRPEAELTPATFETLREPLQTLAIEWEILDPRETRYVLARPEEFNADLTLLRRRYQELADAPPWEDGVRFPDRVQINDLLAFNRAYRKHIADRRPVELAHSWQLEAVLRETDQLYTIWETVKDARGECYYVTIRRQALKKLRELLGEEAYYSGRLPPCVPLWRFQQID